MIEISKTINGEEVVVKLTDPNDVDINKWYAVIDENYQPNKDLFILEKFNKEYPRYDLKDVKTLYNLVSRSTSLQEWLAYANADFVLNVECPEYFKEVLTNEEYNETSVKISEINKLYAQKSNEEYLLAERYRKDKKELDKLYGRKFDQLQQDNNTRILALKSSELPLELQMLIEAYTPSQENDINSKKRFAKELMIKYKLFLLNMCKNEGVENADQLIKELAKL